MLITNKVNAIINVDAVCDDFDVFRVSKESEKLDQTNIFDIAENKYKALAVQYTWGRNSFILFAKGTLVENEFRQLLQETYHDVSVYKITREDLLDEDFCLKNFYFGNRLLVQLLMNSIKAPRAEGLAYNNLTGKLYYGESGWRIKDKRNGGIGWIYFLELHLSKGMYLNADVQTFHRDNSKYGKYVIDHKTGAFRRKLKTDSDKLTTYSNGSFKNRHITVEYLNISSFKKFQQSKLGVMERFRRDVERWLGRYLTLEFCGIEQTEKYAISKKGRPDEKKKKLGQLLNRRGVVIVDENNTDDSRTIASRLMDELVKHYGINCIVGELDKDKYNVRIIHAPEYYEEKGLKDPHSDDLGEAIVQHIVEEAEHFNEKDSASPAVNKIVQELIIKGDILDGQISIYDWRKLGICKNLTFVTREKKKQSFDKNRGWHVNRIGQKTYDYYDYSILQVSPDGQLDFEKLFDDSCMQCSENYKKIIMAYEKFDADYKKNDCFVEGLIFADIDNIHAIILTPEKTIPNTDKLWQGLKETDKNQSISKEALLNAINSFKDDCSLDATECDYVAKLITEINSCEEIIIINSVRKMMNMHKKAAKRLNRYMHEFHGIWISPEIKDSDFEDQYLLDNLLDIKYFLKSEYNGVQSLNYYVGTKRESLNASIHNACPIRKVVSQINQVDLMELFSLMDVEFVRNEQLTVIPFPFKYLREWNEA